MRKFKISLGIFIILIPFIFITGYIINDSNLITAMKVWGTVLFITGIFSSGILLIMRELKLL